MGEIDAGLKLFLSLRHLHDRSGLRRSLSRMEIAENVP